MTCWDKPTPATLALLGDRLVFDSIDGEIDLREDEPTMIMCGIDPSISCTSVCVGYADKHYEIARFSGGATHEDNVASRMRRIENLVSQVDEFLRRHSPSLVCIEEYAYNAGGGNAHFLVEYGGILRWHLTDITPDVHEINPSRLKKFVCGYKASKGKVQLATTLTQRWGVTFYDDNDADAFALWRFAMVLSGQDVAEHDAAREAVADQLGQDRPKKSKAAKDSLFLTQDAKPPF